jgi:hypothetical protein
VGQVRNGATWVDSGFLARCPDPVTAEAKAMAEAIRLLEERTERMPTVLLTDCRSLIDLVFRAEPHPHIPDADRLITAFERMPGLRLFYLHRRCRRMRLAHHLANARRLEAELSARRPGRRSLLQCGNPFMLHAARDRDYIAVSGRSPFQETRAC